MVRYLRRLWSKWYNQLFYFPRLKQRVLDTADLRDKSTAGIAAAKLNERLLLLAYRKIKEKEAYKKIRRKDVILWKVLYLKKLINDIGKCEKCGGHLGGLTIDHIIPNFILKDFGIDTETYYDERNFRLLCKRCNIAKGMHLDFTDPRTKPLILELISKVRGADKYSDLEKVVPSLKVAVMP